MNKQHMVGFLLTRDKATMGCSASLFGVVVLLLVDLIRSWRLIPNAGWELFKLVCLIGKC